MPLKNQQKRPNEGGKARNEDGGGSFTDDLVQVDQHKAEGKTTSGWDNFVSLIGINLEGTK